MSQILAHIVYCCHFLNLKTENQKILHKVLKESSKILDFFKGNPIIFHMKQDGSQCKPQSRIKNNYTTLHALEQFT